MHPTPHPHHHEWPAHTAGGKGLRALVFGFIGVMVMINLVLPFIPKPWWMWVIANGVPIACFVGSLLWWFGGSSTGVVSDGNGLRATYGRRSLVLPLAQLQWGCGVLGGSPDTMTGTVLHLQAGESRVTILASNIILGEPTDYTMPPAPTAQLQMEQPVMRQLLGYLCQLGGATVSLSPPRVLTIAGAHFMFENDAVAMYDRGNLVTHASVSQIRAEPAHHIQRTDRSSFKAMALVVYFPGMAPLTFGAFVSAPWHAATRQVQEPRRASTAMLMAFAKRLGLGDQIPEDDVVSYGRIQ